MCDSIINSQKDMSMADIAAEDYADDEFCEQLGASEFVTRFRDISFPGLDDVSTGCETAEQILNDAGIKDFEVDYHTEKVYLKHWHLPYLSELLDAIFEERGNRRHGNPAQTTEERRSAVHLAIEPDAITGEGDYSHPEDHLADDKSSLSSVNTGVHNDVISVLEDATGSHSTPTVKKSYFKRASKIGKSNGRMSFQSVFPSSRPFAYRSSASERASLNEKHLSLSSSTASSGNGLASRSGSLRTLEPSSDRDSERSRRSDKAYLDQACSQHMGLGQDDQKPADFMISEWIRHNGSSSQRESVIYAPPTISSEKSHSILEQPSRSSSGRKLLDPRLWDRFQMMPREQVTSSATFQTVFKFFKVVCYIFLFVTVLSSAVVNKLCIILMTSSITKDSHLTEPQWPAKTMLVIAMCFPYAMSFLVYTGKTVFGSHIWPSFSLLSSVLFFELLHTLGLSLLVFRVLPQLDMMRAFITLGSVYTVPAFLKTIFEGRDPNIRLTRKCSMFFLNVGAFLIQIGSIVLCIMFQITMTPQEKETLRDDVIKDDITIVVPRPALKDGYFSSDVMYELPISLLLISFAFWENYVEGDFMIFGKVITFKAWKKHLHHARGRLYIFASVWKIIWVIAFAILLQPGYNFNLHYSNGAVTNKGNSSASMATRMKAQNLQNALEFPELNGNSMVGKVKRQSEGSNDGVDPGTASAFTNGGNVNQAPTTLSPESGTQSSPNGPTTSTQASSDANSVTPSPMNVTSERKLFEISPETWKHFEEYGILYLQVICSTIMAYFGSTACKMCMQLIGFSLPLTLATPISVAIVILQGIFRFMPTGAFVWVGVEDDKNTWIFHLGWLGVLWLSEIFVVSHVWFPGNGRIEKLDRLFVTPIRCGILSDQSLLLRRRRNDQDASLTSENDDESVMTDTDMYKADDVVPQIYACATMWHETRAEMTNLLKSLFRMDIDHSGRYLAQKFFKIRDPDYYEFEAHIFIDDAMELSDDDRLVPNSFVSDFMDCIDDSLSSVHERQMSLGPPTRTPTPYGGRLTWRLPGGSKLIAHLKDKHKIRHKKRWSQVMYMYYLLGYRILAQPENLLTKDMMDGCDEEGKFQRVKLTESQLRKRRKAAHFTRSVIFNYVTDEVHNQAENTYILALDGDVDFHPDAVRLLVDRLKTNKKVGASCGRIHPIGSGPLLWYQQFEYAIGHWLQKATEDVFGCVMCAPGCFSLFRGSALMDDNVARTYATRATEAGHYVQYDQGEDRWLSTLLLQQGYRIDYCAASDALTHAPETFSEFFNQRRRWGPSTLANIVDLIGSWKSTISINDNISTLYILYQFCLMVSTVLGPATILLMLAGAFSVVFKTTIVQSYLMALIPAILFIIVCIYSRTTTQMTAASIMSAVYAILMTIVLVGTIGQAIEGGLTSPNVLFLVMLVFIFFLSALMHPEEFFCVIPGALYFICLPTGYLLLTIYYLCNMHIVSWGTREVPKRKSKEEIEEEKLQAEERMRKKEEKRKGILGWMGLNGFFKEMGELLRQVRRDVSKPDKSNTDLLLQELIHEVKSSRQQKIQTKPKTSSTMTDETTEESSHVGSLQEGKPMAIQASPVVAPKLSTVETAAPTEDVQIPIWMQREEFENPSWLQSNICGDGPIKRLIDRENIFWKQIIAKYLLPITEDKLHQEKVKDDLVNLRNNVVFGFFMTSALWIALAMQLQVLQEELKISLFFKIPKWDEEKDLYIEPLGLLFLAFFAAILSVQFVGMFAHRWGTVLHMLSITELSCTKTFTEKDKVRDIISKAMELQKLCNIENEPMPDYDEPLPDYYPSDEENDLDAMSRADTMSLWSVNPPSYHSGLPTGPGAHRRHRQEIFDRRGNSSGAALRTAFEKRFRYEHQHGSNPKTAWDTGEQNVALYDIREHDLAVV